MRRKTSLLAALLLLCTATPATPVFASEPTREAPKRRVTQEVFNICAAGVLSQQPTMQVVNDLLAKSKLPEAEKEAIRTLCEAFELGVAFGVINSSQQPAGGPVLPPAPLTTI
jgi:hypothetical protein